MRKLISIAVSVAILGVLYALVDTKSLFATLRATSPVPLALSLIFLLGIVAVSAVRLSLLAKAAGLAVALPTAVSATLAANALNLFLPARTGDVAKATMLRTPGDGQILPAINISIYEKVTDIFAVFTWGLVALLAFGPEGYAITSLVVAFVTLALALLLFSAAPAHLLIKVLRAVRAPKSLDRYLEAWAAMVEKLWQKPLAMCTVLFLSFAIWAGHFFQIGMMAWALGIKGPWLPLAGTLPLVILAGLAPFTFAGIGTRDAAIVLLIGPLVGADKAAALGVLFWLRYLVPGLVGLPLIPLYFRSLGVRGAKPEASL
jgi:uncharacterized protein (TIRG00374 family)